MSVADLHDLELIWPSPGPNDVIVTGTFDQWSSSIHLAKGDTGFFGSVKAPWGQKVAYKYIVDGLWRCRDDLPQENDGHGNTNNVLRTPEKPEVPAIYAPPVPSLSIPFEGTQGQGYGDVETMVTAVEYLPPVDLTAIMGPLSIPQLMVGGLDQAPSTDTPVSEANLDTAAATEGTVFPASDPLEGPFKQAPSSCDTSIFPINDNPSVSLSPTNGNEEVHDSETPGPMQFINEEPPTSPSVPETAMGVTSVPSESTMPQPGHFPQVPQDISAPTDRVHVPSVPTPTVTLEVTAKQPEAERPRTVEQGHRPQAATTASISQGSTPSTPASSTVTHKKRRSLFARIKHIFDKNNDKQGTKEKSKR